MIEKIYVFLSSIDIYVYCAFHSLFYHTIIDDMIHYEKY